MTARNFWARTAIATCITITLVLALAPSHPPTRLDAIPAVVAGVVGGALLFALAAHRRPRLPATRKRPALVVAKQAVFALYAANEEIVWRRVALGELLPVNVLLALAASSTGFALVHRRARLLHLGTGAAFGTLYLATGAIAACFAAHWTYNVFVGALVERNRG